MSGVFGPHSKPWRTLEPARKWLAAGVHGADPSMALLARQRALGEGTVKTDGRNLMNAWAGIGGCRAWNGVAAVLAVVFFETALGALGQESPRPPSSNSLAGAVYNITLVTDSAPDLTDIESYLRSITSQYATPQEQAIAIWRWSQRLRKQTTNPVEEGHYVLDPVRMFNSYGYCNCGIISGINDAFWLRMGWKARYVQLGDHTVSECSWDGGKTWHMFDSSMSWIIAPPDTYVSVKYMPTYVMFARDVSPVVTIDLGSQQEVAAVRVHAGQEGGFHLSYPDTIEVETSADGNSFALAGSAGFNQVFDPPADYVPWELDAASIFENLPAGGRLAYAYRVLFQPPVAARYVRVTCRNRKGWGMLLSELQVFDRVTVDRSVPPLVVLPSVHGTGN